MREQRRLRDLIQSLEGKGVKRQHDQRTLQRAYRALGIAACKHGRRQDPATGRFDCDPCDDPKHFYE